MWRIKVVPVVIKALDVVTLKLGTIPGTTLENSVYRRTVLETAKTLHRTPKHPGLW